MVAMSPIAGLMSAQDTASRSSPDGVAHMCTAVVAAPAAAR